MYNRLMRFGILAFAVLLLMSDTSHTTTLVAQGSGSGTVTFLYTQEHHGQALPARPFGGNDLGGVSARSTLVQQVRNEVGADNTILLDSGDLLIGTPLSSVFRGEPDILAYNAMGYDASTLGNHAFDFEKNENRLEILQGLANFPMMGANISGLNFDADPGFIKLNRGGLIVLVIGISNVETPSISNPRPGTKFADPIQTARDVIAAEGADADLIVALTHEDTFRDVNLLRQVPEIDVVIGGHTFGFDGIVTRETFSDIDSVPDAVEAQPMELGAPNGVYVRAGGGPFSGRLGTSLGRLEVTVENGAVVRALASNLPIPPDTEFNRRAEDGAPSPDALLALDPVIEGILQPFVEELSARLDQPIGETSVDLNGERADVRGRETNLGNFIADVWRATQGTDIGLQNGGGIRNSIPAGPITLGNVLSVQPFGNTIVTLSVTGEQLRTAMENGVSRVEDGSGRFPQISGMTLVFDGSKEPGSRVVEITVGGQPLDAHRTYSITTNSFVGLGGDGYTVFNEAQNFFDTQFVDADVVADFIREAGTISPQIDGRIRDVAAQ